MPNYKYKTVPYKHQIDAVYKLYNKKFGALLHEQGTGKSKTAIDIVSNLYLEEKINAVLLIAPNTIHTQWEKEQLKEHSPVEYIGMSWNSTGRTKAYQKKLFKFISNDVNKIKWLCVNVEAFSSSSSIEIFRNFVVRHKTAIVLDEATTIKNIAAKRTYNITYELGEVVRNRKKIVKSMPSSEYRYILTGTMVTNTPFDLYSMFEFLSQNYFGMNYFSFKNRYGIEKTEQLANTNKKYKRLITQKEIDRVRTLLNQNHSIEEISLETGLSETNILYLCNNPTINSSYKNLSELKKKIEPYSHIVRKKDCLDLPPKVYEKLTVELTPAQKKIYRNLEREYLAEYSNKELTVQNKLGLVLRLSQITGGFFPYKEHIEENEEITSTKKIMQIGANAKIIALKRDLDETDEAVIIFSRFTAEIELIEKELTKYFKNKIIKTYYGKTANIEREKIKKDFKKGAIDILIGNPAAAGVGLNLQRSRLVYYYSNSHSLYYREQSEDRVHRIGQEKTVVYKDIIAISTIDEKIYNILKEKKDLLEYFRDNSFQEFISNKT